MAGHDDHKDVKYVGRSTDVLKERPIIRKITPNIRVKRKSRFDPTSYSKNGWLGPSF